MRTALITTTVNVPRVLELYRKLAGPEIQFFVALDRKSADLREWTAELLERGHGDSNTILLGPGAQEKYECSELLGWDTDSRRNIALLEALKWGADLIVSIDDDMIPLGGEFCFGGLFEWPFDGLQLGAPNRWFNAGFTMPEAKQRGLPFDTTFAMAAESVVDARIGVAQGIILGVPDTDAPSAMTNRPFVHSASDILRNGFVVHPHAHAVFNSQLTAFRRELAPAFAQFYNHQGRNTDILASVLMRRIMRDRGLYTYFGLPCGFHARAPRPLFKDLKQEMFGLERIASFAEHIWIAPTQQLSVTDDCRDLLVGYAGFTDENKEAAFAWLNDCERVL